MKLLWVLLVLSSCTMIKEEKNISSNVNLGSNGKNIVINKDVIIESKEKSAQKILYPEIGIFVYPTLYSTMGTVEFLRQLERSKVKIRTIGSFGLGAVISALYAKEGTTSYLEWKMFALLRRLESLKPYEDEWKSEILLFTKNEFKKSKVSDLRLNLFVPLNEKDIAIEKLTVVELIEKTIDITEKNHYINTVDFNVQLDAFYKTDLQYNLLFLPQNIGFDKLTSYNYGLYTYYLGKVMQMEDTIKMIRSDATVKLDKIYSSSDIYTMFFPQIVDLKDQVLEQVKRWQEDNSASLLNYNN